METFKTTTIASRKMGERNDCGVKALAIACNLPYQYAHQALAECGREFGSITKASQVKDALDFVGAKITSCRIVTSNAHSRWEAMDNVRRGIETGKDDRRLSMRNIARSLNPRKAFIVSARNHFAAVVGGRLEDVAANEPITVNHYWQIGK